MAMTPQIIVFERTREVYNFMMNGSRQTKEVVHFFSKKWTDENVFNEGISEMSKARTIHNYIRKVKDTFMNFEAEVEAEKGRQLARLDDLYAKNMKIQDYKAAKDVIKTINEMVGFNAATKTDLTTKGESLNAKPTPKEIKDINESLEHDC